MPSFQENNKAELNKYYKPTDKEQDARKWVYRRFYEMGDSGERKRAEKEWVDGERQWEALKEETDDWMSGYYVPMTFSVIESILAEMAEQSLRPMVMARGSEDLARAKLMNHVLDYVAEVSNFDDEMENVFRGGLVHGTTIAQEYYLKDPRMVKDIRDLVSASTKRNKKRKEYESEEREVYEYDDLMMEWIDPRHVFVDEKATEFNRGPRKARDAIRLFNMPYDAAKEFFGNSQIWNHLNNFRYVKPGRPSDYYQFYQPDSKSNERSDNEVQVLWYWSRTPEDWLIVTINDVVVRMGPNIYKHKQIPFAKGTDIRRIGKFYGKGEPKVLESIQHENNTLRRMIIDRHHLDIDKMFTVDPQLQLDDEDTIARPHGVIPGSPDQVRAVEYGDVPISVERTLRAINEDKTTSTGIDDRFQAAQKTPSTATEAAILKEATLKRIRLKLKSYEKGFLTDIGRMRVANILQFYSQPKLEKIIGEENTQEFKNEVMKLAQRGLVEMQDGELFKKQFREIRTEGTELFLDAKGSVSERKRPGFHFFELRPEYFIPMARGGYDIKFIPGPSLPVSKPLLRQQTNEMFQQIVPFIENTSYDIEKLIDKVLEVNELNPQDFKSEEALTEEGVGQDLLNMSIELASRENQMLVEGREIPTNGTPMATEPHALVHINFLQSNVMSQQPEEVFEKLVRHIQGEILAINQRNTAGGGQLAPGQQGSAPAGGSAGTGVGQGGQNVLPARIEGGNQVPTGRVLGNG